MPTYRIKNADFSSVPRAIAERAKALAKGATIHWIGHDPDADRLNVEVVTAMDIAGNVVATQRLHEPRRRPLFYAFGEEARLNLHDLRISYPHVTSPEKAERMARSGRHATGSVVPSSDSTFDLHCPGGLERWSSLVDVRAWPTPKPQEETMTFPAFVPPARPTEPTPAPDSPAVATMKLLLADRQSIVRSTQKKVDTWRQEVEDDQRNLAYEETVLAAAESEVRSIQAQIDAMTGANASANVGRHQV